MLKASQIELCGTCHDEAAGQAQKKVPHKPATTGCSTCHDPHGSKNTTLLHDTLNGLCLDCHAVPPVPEGAKTTPTVPMGDTHTVSRDALPHSMQLDLDRNGRGHPLANHPTSAAADPLNKERPFTCLSCHAAHGSDTPRLIAFELKPGEGVCQKCHEM